MSERDIVERLQARRPRHNQVSVDAGLFTDIDEAAAEILRLRAQVATPMRHMEPTDEMVQVAFDAMKGALPNDERKLVHQAALRANIRTILRASLAMMPHQYLSGWIAGRDAAAGEAEQWAWTTNTCNECGGRCMTCLGTELRERIEDMEPLA